MPSTEFLTWVDAPVGDVFAAATDTRRLPDWFDLVSSVRTVAGSTLASQGTEVEATCRRAPGRVRIATIRRVRDIVHLEVTVEDGRAGRLCFSFGAWDGGTAVELQADLEGWQLSRRALRRALRRSARQLAAMVTSGGRAPVAAPGRRSPLAVARGAGVAPGR